MFRISDELYSFVASDIYNYVLWSEYLVHYSKEINVDGGVLKLYICADVSYRVNKLPDGDEKQITHIWPRFMFTYVTKDDGQELQTDFDISELEKFL